MTTVSKQICLLFGKTASSLNPVLPRPLVQIIETCAVTIANKEQS